MDKTPRIGVGVLVEKDGKLLLGLRAKEGAYKGTWGFPGGKLEYGETVVECAKRETEEECGIRLDAVEDAGVAFSYGEDRTHWVTIFQQAYTNQESKVAEPHAHSEWQWFDKDNLPEPLFPPVKKYLEKYDRL